MWENVSRVFIVIPVHTHTHTGAHYACMPICRYAYVYADTAMHTPHPPNHDGRGLEINSFVDAYTLISTRYTDFFLSRLWFGRIAYAHGTRAFVALSFDGVVHIHTINVCNHWKANMELRGKGCLARRVFASPFNFDYGEPVAINLLHAGATLFAHCLRKHNIFIIQFLQCWTFIC